MYDGFGTTECGGIASDGEILPGVDVKLIDCPELGYFTSDQPPRGEICVKTAHMISGYYKDPENTEKYFVDDYFRTGGTPSFFVSQKALFDTLPKTLGR